MIVATINATKEAILRIKLIGTNGLEIDIPGIIDTGFSEYLSLPNG